MRKTRLSTFEKNFLTFVESGFHRLLNGIFGAAANPAPSRCKRARHRDPCSDALPSRRIGVSLGEERSGLYGTACCAEGRQQEVIGQDAAAFYNSHAMIGASAAVGAVETGSRLGRPADRPQPRRAAPESGPATCSRHSIDDATVWFVALERTYQQQLQVEDSGIKPQHLSAKTVRDSQVAETQLDRFA